MLQKQSAKHYKLNEPNKKGMERHTHLPSVVSSTILKSHEIQISRSILTGPHDCCGKTTLHKGQLSEITLKSNVYRKVPHREEERTAV